MKGTDAPFTARSGNIERAPVWPEEGSTGNVTLDQQASISPVAVAAHSEGTR